MTGLVVPRFVEVLMSIPLCGLGIPEIYNRPRLEGIERRYRWMFTCLHSYQNEYQLNPKIHHNIMLNQKRRVSRYIIQKS